MTEGSLLALAPWAQNAVDTLAMMLGEDGKLGQLSCNVSSSMELKARFKGGGYHHLLELSQGLQGKALLSIDSAAARRLFPQAPEDDGPVTATDETQLMDFFNELSGLLSGQLSQLLGTSVGVTGEGELRPKPAKLDSPLLTSIELPMTFPGPGSLQLLFTLSAALCEELSLAAKPPASAESDAPSGLATAALAEPPPTIVGSRNSSQRGSTANKDERPDLGILSNITVEVRVLLGRATLCVEDLLALTEGSLIELDRLVDDPVEMFVRDRKVAAGDVVVIDERFGVKVKESHLRPSLPA